MLAEGDELGQRSSGSDRKNSRSCVLCRRVMDTLLVNSDDAEPADLEADGCPLGVGSRVRIKQPRLPLTTWTVTELSPGESFTWIAAGPGIRTTASHRIHPAEPGSVVTLMVDQNGIIGRLIGKFMAGLTNRYLAIEGHGLKAHAERPSQAL